MKFKAILLGVAFALASTAAKAESIRAYGPPSSMVFLTTGAISSNGCIKTNGSSSVLAANCGDNAVDVTGSGGLSVTNAATMGGTLKVSGQSVFGVPNGSIGVATITAAGLVGAPSFTATATPGFSGDGSGLTGFAVTGSSVNWISPSSYTFLVATNYVGIASVAVAGIRGSRSLFLPASVSIYNTASVWQTICCKIMVNGVIATGEIIRCASAYGGYVSPAALALNPLVTNSATGTVTVSLWCNSTAGDGSISLQAARVSVIEF